MHLQYNNLGSLFIKSMIDAIKFDDYLRVLDVRRNKLSKKLLKDDQLDLVGNLTRNESLTNVDFRLNDILDKELKAKLSKIMLRNIDKIRKDGITCKGSWLNKGVLILDEQPTEGNQPKE